VIEKLNNLERRMNDNFVPEVKICDTWVPIECITDAHAVLGDEFEGAFREEWGDEITDCVMECIKNGRL
jgi:hypothetical protein